MGRSVNRVDREKVISQLETDYRDAEHRGWILVPVSRITVKNAIALLKEQETEISRISNEYLDLVKKASKQPQIVRCKDCLWNSGTAERPYCQHHSTGRTPEWFCASGEKRF